MNIYSKNSLFERPVSGVIGRASSPLNSVMMLSHSPMMPGPSPEDFKRLYDGMTPDQKEKLKNLNVNLNSENLIEQWKNILRNENAGPVAKVVGLVTQPLLTVPTALARADHYNNIANSVTLYTNNNATMAHELGHAEDNRNKLDMSESKLGKDIINLGYGIGRALPPVELYQEAAASTNAMKNSENLKNDFAANRLLGSAIGTYGAANFAKPIWDYEDEKGTFDWIGDSFNNEDIGHYFQTKAEELSVPVAGAIAGGLSGGLFRPFTLAKRIVQPKKKVANSSLRLYNQHINGLDNSNVFREAESKSPETIKKFLDMKKNQASEFRKVFAEGVRKNNWKDHFAKGE